RLGARVLLAPVHELRIRREPERLFLKLEVTQIGHAAPFLVNSSVKPRHRSGRARPLAPSRRGIVLPRPGPRRRALLNFRLFSRPPKAAGRARPRLPPPSWRARACAPGGLFYRNRGA